MIRNMQQTGYFIF